MYGTEPPKGTTNVDSSWSEFRNLKGSPLKRIVIYKGSLFSSMLVFRSLRAGSDFGRCFVLGKRVEALFSRWARDSPPSSSSVKANSSSTQSPATGKGIQKQDRNLNCQELQVGTWAQRYVALAQTCTHLVAPHNPGEAP